MFINLNNTMKNKVDVKNPVYNFQSTGDQIAKDFKHNIEGKQFLITGTSAGIGEECVKNLLPQGAIVTCACRNTTLMAEKLEKMKETIPDIHERTYVIKLDLSDFSSIREFVTNQKEKVGKLDILLNNAGIMACPLTFTKDGHEMQFGTNHLGHQMLTGLLIDLLQASTAPRVINVASNAADQPVPEHVDFLNIKKGMDEKKQGEWMQQGQSKLANVQFSSGLSKRWGTKILTFSLNPGFSPTELKRHQGCCGLCLITCLGSLIGKSIQQESATQIMACVADGIEEWNGLQLNDCKLGKTTELKPDIEKELFDYSEKETGVKFEQF